MDRINRIVLIKDMYCEIKKESSASMYDFYEPRSGGANHKQYAFRYHEGRDEFEVMETPGCENIGSLYQSGSNVYNSLMLVREHWYKFPFSGGSCTPSSQAYPISGEQVDVVPNSKGTPVPQDASHLSPDELLQLSPDEMLGSAKPTSRVQELFPSGAIRNRLQNIRHSDSDFASVETVRPSGGQLAEFSGGNWRYHQPNLGEMKWFIENGVTDFIRLSGDGSGDIIKDPQVGVNITIAVQKRFVEGLGAKLHRPSAHSGYRFGQGYTGSIKRCNPILSGGNCLVHCRWGADRTGYIVAAFLKESGAMTDLEELWNYTIGFNRWESKVCRNASNLGYSKYLDGFYPLDQFCKRHSDCDVCDKLEQLR